MDEIYPTVDEIYPRVRMRSNRKVDEIQPKVDYIYPSVGWDLAECGSSVWLSNAKVATVLGSILVSSDTDESEAREN